MAFAAGVLGYQTRMIRFMPKSNVSLTDLDQIVALAGGEFTLLFSIYDAAKGWRSSARIGNDS